MSIDDFDPPSRPSGLDLGPLGAIPRVSRRQARLEAVLARLSGDAALGRPIGWLVGSLGGKVDIDIDAPEVLWRASGLARTGCVSVFVWPRLETRLGIGLDTPLAHAVVDRLLGFDRRVEETRLQLTPVEWGVLTFVVAEALSRLRTRPGVLGAWDLTLDRVGAEPFDPGGLGRIVTLRWPIRLGPVAGSLRAWLPESLLTRWQAASPLEEPKPPTALGPGLADLSGVWRAQAGTIRLPRGLRTLRVGGVLPLSDTRLRGSPANPTGTVELILAAAGQDGRFVLDAQPVPLTGGGRLSLNGPLRHEPTPREATSVPVTPPNPGGPGPSSGPDPNPLDVPVTLVVELGRVNLTLGRLANLAAGDVVELGRHSREPVELTSGGRLVARGELVQIDTDLGLRITHVFL